jgi:magnesium-transporting ATPase (P-type)
VTVTDANRDALENQFGLADRVVDPGALGRSVDRFRERGISLPTFAELADPSTFDHARTVAFCILAFAQLFFSFACRSDRYTLPQLGLLTNPHLLAAILISSLLQLSVVMLPIAQQIFEVPSHPGRDWLLVFGLALAPVSIVEVCKLVFVISKSLGTKLTFTRPKAEENNGGSQG